jgi:hypothetical protein
MVKDEEAGDAAGPETIDSTFRSGSLTAIGVVVGFSLGFLSNWATISGEWRPIDIIAVSAIGLGVLLQIRSLAGMLSVSSLVRATYERLVRIFLVGLVFSAVGVALAILGDVVGLGHHAARLP